MRRGKTRGGGGGGCQGADLQGRLSDWVVQVPRRQQGNLQEALEQHPGVWPLKESVEAP